MVTTRYGRWTKFGSSPMRSAAEDGGEAGRVRRWTAWVPRRSSPRGPSAVDEERVAGDRATRPARRGRPRRPATSTGSPIAVERRRSARSTRPRTPGRPAPPRCPGVRMNVGATALTVMPWRPHSTARHFVRWATAALRHAVDRLGRERDEARLGAEADDPPEALPDHRPSGGLAREEDALHVDPEGVVEVLLGARSRRGSPG